MRSTVFAMTSRGEGCVKCAPGAPAVGSVFVELIENKLRTTGEAENEENIIFD